MNKAQKLKGMRWRRVSSPEAWKPKDGEELIGYYTGRTKKEGTWGQYEVALVLVPYKGAYTISGTNLIEKLDAGMISRGDAVRIVFLGWKALEGDHRMKMFDLYVGESEALSADDLDEVDAAVRDRSPS